MNTRRSRFKRTQLPKIKLAFLGTGVFFVFLLLFQGARYMMGLIDSTGMTPGTVVKLAFDDGADLHPIDGRVNVLLLGIAGGTHEGPDLTDTILVLSLDQEQKTMAMISIPRDVWSDTLKDKINSAYHYGEQKKQGGGLVLAKAVVADMLGLPIQKSLVFDFSAFRDIIDLVGGVTIDVPQAFTDPQYPVAGKENDDCGGDTQYLCRYEPLHFDAGPQRMDGDRALKYVRSRHAEGSEGNDFARSRRQQQVLMAIKQKVTSREILMQPKTLSLVYQAFDKASNTDFNIGEILTAGKLVVGIPEAHITRVSLEDQLYNPPNSLYGRYVLLPKEGPDSLHAYIREKLAGTNVVTAGEKPNP